MGAWSVYPYLPSGNLLVSGVERGLFVLRPSFLADEHATVVAAVHAQDDVTAADVSCLEVPRCSFPGPRPPPPHSPLPSSCTAASCRQVTIVVIPGWSVRRSAQDPRFCVGERLRQPPVVWWAIDTALAPSYVSGCAVSHTSQCLFPGQHFLRIGDESAFQDTIDSDQTVRIEVYQGRLPPAWNSERNGTYGSNNGADRPLALFERSLRRDCTFKRDVEAPETVCSYNVAFNVAAQVPISPLPPTQKPVPPPRLPPRSASAPSSPPPSAPAKEAMLPLPSHLPPSLQPPPLPPPPPAPAASPPPPPQLMLSPPALPSAPSKSPSSALSDAVLLELVLPVASAGLLLSGGAMALVLYRRRNRRSSTCVQSQA